MILNDILKEKYKEELDSKIKEIIEKLTYTKKRTYSNYLNIAQSEENNKVCLDCIQINQLDIEDIGGCSNYSCSTKQNHEYKKNIN